MLTRYCGIYVAAIALASLALIAGPSPAADRSQPPAAKPAKYLATPNQILELGLFPEDMKAGAGRHFQNKCFFGDLEFSISDALLDRYIKRGFTPATTCLGLAAYYVHYHPETGKPLKVVSWDRDKDGFLLEIPDCFKNGTPYLDCDFVYDEFSGYKNTPQERAAVRQTGLKIDAAFKQLLASGMYARECGCSDLQGYRTLAGLDAIRIKSGAGCYLDTIPACARSLVRGRDPAGWKLLEIGEENTMKVFSGITVNEVFNISPRLPRGYAHRSRHPEGDDESEFLKLDVGDKIGIGDAN